MSVVTYEGRVEQGQIRLKDAVALPEGAQVYVVVTPVADTALDPEPMQIAADVRAGLADFAAGRVFEIETANDLARLVAEGDSPKTQLHPRHVDGVYGLGCSGEEDTRGKVVL